MKTETKDYQQQAIDFLNATSTAITFKFKGHKPHFAGETVSRDVWRVKIKNKLHSYSFDFGQSIAEQGKQPTEYSVLACLQKYEVETFEDFCGEFGYEELNENYRGQNKQSMKIYLAVYKEWDNVNKLFTDEQIDLLREIN